MEYKCGCLKPSDSVAFSLCNPCSSALKELSAVNCAFYASFGGEIYKIEILKKPEIFTPSGFRCDQVCCLVFFAAKPAEAPGWDYNYCRCMDLFTFRKTILDNKIEPRNYSI